jgi:hypothetical protein
MQLYAILDLLDESSRFLVLPRAAPGPRGAAGGPTPTVFAQNPDGSIATFDAATESWTPLE